MEEHILEEHALECAFCYLKFAGFYQLALHVNEAHLAPEERQYGTTETAREAGWNEQNARGQATGTHGRRRL